jgi:hypothetical protein
MKSCTFAPAQISRASYGFIDGLSSAVPLFSRVVYLSPDWPRDFVLWQKSPKDYTGFSIDRVSGKISTTA